MLEQSIPVTVETIDFGVQQIIVFKKVTYSRSHHPHKYFNVTSKERNQNIVYCMILFLFSFPLKTGSNVWKRNDQKYNLRQEIFLRTQLAGMQFEVNTLQDNGWQLITYRNQLPNFAESFYFC